MFAYDEIDTMEIFTEEELMAMLAFIGLFALAFLAFGILCYVFQSLSLCTMAKRRGIKNPGLAWIPWVAPYWIAGSLADQYQYVARGQVKNRRIVMLVLSIVALVLSSITSKVNGVMMQDLFDAISAENTQGILDALSNSTGAGVLGTISSVVGIALFVFWNISLFDIYNSCDPDHATVFLVLGILFAFLPPFSLFACRKKDGGMPPRIEEPQPQPQPQRTYQEPWENT